MPDYGLRKDKSKKGLGYFGELKRPGGGVSTEMSIGVNFGGKETEIPSLVPGISKNELNYILKTKPNPQMWKTGTGSNILRKAVDHAQLRISSGMSPFAQEGEQNKFERIGRKITSSDKLARPKYVNVKDNRVGVTETNNLSGKYFRPLLKNIIKASNEYGVNPYEMLALGLQETRFGQTMPHKGRTGDVFNVKASPEVAADLGHTAEFLKEKRRNADSFYKGKFGRPATQAEYLQFWQGRGWVDGKLGWRDLPTGNTIVDHIKSLKKNPGITKLLMEK